MTAIEKFVSMILIAGGMFILFSIWVSITGLHIDTGSGDHTGYITSVEKNGLFFKTGRAYLKTSTQSTQEDAYCVVSNDVYKQLQEFSVTGKQVNVAYHSWFSAGVANCQGEDAIIDRVTAL